ncbi:carboxypeptidase M32 [Paenibacillus apiarius]|uniref:Metal-dependent carboxypeptidase n=1 Tax=Paenibacillus apiarius TaxID=46240 RepID=A0ABT4DTZ8_9BACL|nr:carboxypeptidase M32 [Paenibacillus apiarius]MCY9515871.1 carboxypeptidase M32 [Paenibacillus apiarius]MCY9520781.1 carboxypeptidase M32 [Paenibacillus apiarius]MCY9553485.1 carboxypeptidase M32 [Paenibacillus apiarius]MCY9557991.1 carboxypeptidase M32 [Paenibacillus apiarius]MCY9685846.1 carboxypeptidase M32 [Paenibacillus apiarius]
MSTQNQSVLQQFHNITGKLKSYEEAIGLMQWDLRTGAPRKGAEQRAQTIGVLSGDMFKLSVSDEMGSCLDALEQPDQFQALTAADRKMVTDARKEFNRSRLIPPELYQEYVVLTSHAETVWEEAKEKADFDMFKPYLRDIVAKTQQFIDYWGVKDTRYDTLLDMYEPGMTVAKLDETFGQLRDSLVPLVQSVQASSQPEFEFLYRECPIEGQKAISLQLLKEMGYDFDAGRLDESVHPFMIGLNPGDARITTNYKTDDVASAIFSSLHEGGHALYEQNISKEFAGTPLSSGTSMGIHESQSRFWENVVGRSRPFWQHYYGLLQNTFPTQLQNVTEDMFYRAINRVEPSLIRIEADEVTYNLHIIIRYEIEKMLFNDELSVDELPRVWQEKYESYLGVRPQNDGEGVLQDVHWAGGGFGYFPSYSLGNMYAAQIMNTLRKAMPSFDDTIAQGQLLPIKEWLSEQIYQYGKLLTPSEIIMKVTGEALNPQYLVDYLTEKSKDVYGM